MACLTRSEVELVESAVPLCADDLEHARHVGPGVNMLASAPFGVCTPRGRQQLRACAQ